MSFKLDKATCEFCHREAFKTNGNSELICENRANSGRCEGYVSIKHETKSKYGRKVGRNETCPCGSGAKYKKCCLNKPEESMSEEDIKKLPL